MSDNALAVAVPRRIPGLALRRLARRRRGQLGALQARLPKGLEGFPRLVLGGSPAAAEQSHRSERSGIGGPAPPSINLRLSAIRKLAAKAAENDLLDRSVAQGIVSLKGVTQSGNRAGNWLTREQARDLLAQPDIETMEGKRGPRDSGGAFGLRPAPQRARRGQAKRPTPI